MKRIKTSFKVWMLAAVLLTGLLLLISFTNPLVDGPDDMAAEKQIAVAYVAEREQIPPERLQIVDAFWEENPVLNRRYGAVTLFDEAGGRQFYKVLVDPVAKRALEIAEVEAASRQSRQARYGKLRPALHERLQTAASDEIIEIAVWFTGPDRMALLDQLLDRHPEAQAAAEPERWLYEQIRLNEQIGAEYEQLEQQTLLAVQAPLAEKLRTEGYEVTAYSDLPSLTTRVPPAVIREIARRQEVAVIYLLEGEMSTFEKDSLDAPAEINPPPSVTGDAEPDTGHSSTGPLSSLRAWLPDFRRPAVEIPFETIEMDQYGKYPHQSPELRIITAPDEATGLAGLIPAEVIEALSKIDYARSLAIVLFHGQWGSNGYWIQADKVTYDGRTVHIDSTFHKPAHNEMVSFVVTSPYHVVAIEKPSGIEDHWWTTFILDAEGREVTRRRVAAPNRIEPAFTSPLSPLTPNDASK